MSRTSPRLAVAALLVAGVALLAPPHAHADTAPTTSITTLSVATNPDRPRIGTNNSDRRSTELNRVVAELGERNTEGFSSVGVTWSAESAGTEPEVQVRTRSSDGWSDWQTITDGPAINTGDQRLATDPIWVGDSDGVAVRLVGGSDTHLRDAQVVLMKSPVVASDADPQTLSAQSASDLAPRPEIITRKGWGADESWRCNEDKMGTTVKAAVVHHTAGSNSYSKTQSASIIRDIYAYHTKTLGWCDIGYNFLVDKYGQVFEGRWGGVNLPVHGAHAADWNTNTMGMSFMGNYETANPPSVMLDAGADLIAWKLDAFQRQAKGKLKLAGKTVNVIFGHGDVMATACPGKNIRSRMSGLRDAVEDRMGPPSAIGKDWARRGGAADFGHPHVGETAVEGGRHLGLLRSSKPKSLWWHPSTGSHETRGPIETLYQDLGGPAHPLGWPRSDVHDVTGGRGQGFTNGAIYRSGSTPTKAIHGAVYQYYRATAGGPGGLLGLPRTNVTRGEISGSQWARFEHGLIVSYGDADTHHLTDEIAGRWVKLTDKSEAKLGKLLKPDYATSGGRKAAFENGKIVWNASTGRLAVVFN